MRRPRLNLLVFFELSSTTPEKGDKGSDTQDFVDARRSLAVTPHVVQNTSSRIDGRSTRHEATRSVSAAGSRSKRSLVG